MTSCYNRVKFSCLPFVGEFSLRVEVHDFSQCRLPVSLFRILHCNKKKGFQGRLSKRATNFWFCVIEKRQTHIPMPDSIWISAIMFNELLMKQFFRSHRRPYISLLASCVSTHIIATNLYRFGQLPCIADELTSQHIRRCGCPASLCLPPHHCDRRPS